MTPIPALTRSYFTRANMPFGSNNTSQLVIESYYHWLLQACLRDIISTGTTGGTRHANSIWLCRGSSNGAGVGGAISAVGVAGTDNWGGAVFPGTLVRGPNGTNHHWMLLENVNLSTELLLNFSQTAGHLVFSIAPSGTFTGGSATTAPQPSPTTASVQANQTTHSVTDNGQYNFFGDTSNTGNTNYGHFTIADSGEFFFCMSRVGLLNFQNFICFWKTSNPQVGDTRNRFVISGDTSFSGRGSPSLSRTQQSGFCASIQPNGSQKGGGGFSYLVAAGASVIGGLSVDAIDGLYKTFPIWVIETSPMYVDRGTLPDIYHVGDAPVGSSIPNSVAQERIVISNLVLPFNSVIPII